MNLSFRVVELATGFPGCEPACPVAQDKPRMVDEGFVIVEPDEVKTKAQPSTGRKEVWTFTSNSRPFECHSSWLAHFDNDSWFRQYSQGENDVGQGLLEPKPARIQPSLACFGS